MVRRKRRSRKLFTPILPAMAGEEVANILAEQKQMSSTRPKQAKSGQTRTAAKSPRERQEDKRRKWRQSEVKTMMQRLPSGTKGKGGRTGSAFRPKKAIDRGFVINKRTKNSMGGRVVTARKSVIGNLEMARRTKKGMIERVDRTQIKAPVNRFQIYGALDSGMKNSAKRRKTPIPAEVQKTMVREPSPMSAPVSPNYYRLDYQTGMRPGKAMKMMKLMAGEVNKEVFNSERNITVTEGAGREGLTKTFGFNQKLFSALDRSTVEQQEIFDIISTEAFNSSTPTEVRLSNSSNDTDFYACVTKITQRIKLSNENE